MRKSMCVRRWVSISDTVCVYWILRPGTYSYGVKFEKHDVGKEIILLQDILNWAQN